MKAKIYVGAKKYALYIGRKIVEKTLEFLTLPDRFVSKKVQELKQYLIYGQSVQDGIPTPATPIEVESVGVRTKNLFDKSNAVIGAYVNASGSIVTEPLYSYSDFIKVTPGKTYTVSGTDNSVSGSNKRVHGYDSAKQWKLQIKAQVASSKRDYAVTFTIPEGCEYVIFSGMTTADNRKELDSVQIEEGSVATSYEPYGYKIPVVVGGKNLFNKNNLTSGYINVNGRISTATTWEVSEFIKVLPNTNYTLSGVVQIYADIYHAFYDKDKNPISVIPVKVGITQLTSPANAEYIRFSIRIASYDKETVQLEQGSTATAYVPYSSTTTNIYLYEPLRKLGDYADYIDYENQKVVRNVYCQTDIYGNPAVSSRRYLCNANANCISNIGDVTVAWSNLLQDGSAYVYQDFSSIYNYIGLYRNSNGVSRIVISKILECQTVEDFQNALKGIEIYYPLATPTEEQITLPAISLPSGTVTIDTETNIKPSKINITGDIDNERRY